MSRASGEGSLIAVVGISCRLPRAPDPEAYWRLLAGGGDAIAEMPASRWGLAGLEPGAGLAGAGPGASRGGFLDRVDGFDAAFFGISPREAGAMDPQQRLMLELGWEALEDAGISASDARGEDAGVFLGAIAGDYANLAARQGPGAVGHHTMVGLQRSIIANRISYALGLTGPSLTVDAAQSASLVAVHLACESLRKGESALALAGGVHLNLDPRGALSALRFGGLSDAGRCFTFDARADGFVRGEGGGLVVLKPLADARADGDRVYCVIQGSAVNNDGGGEGLTVPSRTAQESVLRRAYRRAGLKRRDVQYVELHGSGTPIGDPIEATALGAVLGAGRRDDELPVGSAKTNIGHLEGAAGIAGLIKAALAIEHRRIPPSLNFERANPAIPLDRLGLRVQGELGPWPAEDRALVAGVSSFGMGGTNCHVVVSEAPAPPANREAPPPKATGPEHLRPLPSGASPFLLSAASEPALRESAKRLSTHLREHPELDATDVAYSLAAGRAALKQRAAVLVKDRAQLLTALDDLAAGSRDPELVRGAAGGDRGAVFLFPGQGSQWPGMALALREASPAFAHHLAECEAALDPHIDFSIRDALAGGGGSASPDRIEVIQPALFAVLVSLARQWLACGVEPVAVAGHSQGEVAAAHIAGALSLEDAARLAAVRGRVISKLAGQGSLVSIALADSQLGSLLDSIDDSIEVAACNGPASTIVAGEREALDRLLERCGQLEVSAREIPAAIASHSAFVEPLREELLEALGSIAPRRGEIPFYSTVTGGPLDTRELGPDYWYRNLRETVRFEQVTRRLLEDGPKVMIEVSPHPVLAAAVEATIEDALPDPEDFAVVPTLRRNEGGRERFARSLAEAHVSGARVRWEACFDGAQKVRLPTYPFQRKPYWLDPGEGEGPIELPSIVRDDGSAGEDRRGDFASSLEALSHAEGVAFVAELVKAEVAAILGHDSAEEVPVGVPFKELGFDSVAAAELRKRLRDATGLRLPAAAAFNHPTVTALAAFVHRRALGLGERIEAIDVAAVDEPIAIVGVGCRYPGGVDGAEQLWRLLADGREGLSGLPVDRGWNLERLFRSDAGRDRIGPGLEGGFLRAPGEFDAEFFGISPREAVAMDPQQRLLLETCWEALEGSGVDPCSLASTRTGVFVGISSQDYTAGLRAAENELDGYRMTGLISVASGRVAYHLGLEGPAITVDTACSSSLVALHLASQALRGGECSLALAGGATVLGSPGMFDEMARQRGLAPDGRCKSFAEAADGTGFSEGVGVLVLERLSDAERNGHPVLATIRGSAVNQDGASNGLTAPNGPSQERVIRQALANARLTPQDIDAVEAHGTGTTLGDPIEAGALLATYGQDREEPLKLGSIKSNIGHTQAAAGVAGVIKMVMAMREGVLPRTLHVDEPSSKVDWEAGRIELVTEPQPWAPNGHPRRAGVSSFGISGTNAHLILEEAPQPADAEPAEDAGQGGELPEPLLPGPLLLPLSAKSEPALRESAKRLAAHLAEDPDLDPTDVGFSLATTRSDFERRAVAVGEDREELLSALSALARGEEAPSLVRGLARAEHRPVFLFPGQGSQWQGMALELLESSPAFATHMAACEEALSAHVDWSLAAVLRDEKGEWLNHLDIVQPALFAVMVSLARLWMDLGVEPAVLLGHSQGEIAAAHIAGGLSLGDAALIVSRRARAMAGLAGKGAMLSVSSPLSLLRPHLEPFGESVSVAAINGPASLALSGEPDALAQLRAHCEQEGIRAQPIAVDYAAHSIQIDALREELLDAFAPIDPKTGRVPFHSTVTGEALDTVNLDPEYWYCNLRQTVLFEPALRSLLEDGHRTLIELAPHPVLAFGAQETIEDALEEPSDATVLGTLRREEGGPKRFALSLAEAHAAGASPDWQALFRGSGAASVALPTYPFQRKRYWLASSQGASDPRAIGQTPADHPLLGAAIEEPDAGGLTLTGRLSLQTHPWLADHAVAGTVLLPGTAFVELALRAGSEVGCETLEELTLQAPLLLPERGAVQIQVSVGEPAEDGGREIAVYSRPEPSLAEPAGTEWATHATGLLGAGEAQPPRPLAQWPPEGAEPIDVSTLYERLAEAGFEYGPAFQGAEAAWRCGEELFAEVSLAPEQAPEAGRFAIHPALLDSALHVLALSLVESGSDGGLRLPFAWREVSVAGAGADALRVRIVPTDERASLAIHGRDGELLGWIGSLELRPADPSQLGEARGSQDGLLGLEWVEVELDEERKGDEEAAADLEMWFCEPGAPEDDPVERARTVTAAALERLQGFLAAPASTGTRLAILTEGAVAVDGGESPDPAGAALWGLVRSAQTEHPGRFVLIDSDRTEASEEALHRATIGDETQLALRRGVVLAPRIGALQGEGDVLSAPAGPWCLESAGGGTLDDLALLPNPDAGRPLGAEEVRVAIHAAGLNFRDVLIALGLYPEEAPIGSEGAGTVIETGSAVRDLAPGDRVMGMVPRAFGPIAATERDFLVPIPDEWSFAQAAATPVAFATAYYALVDLAALQPGEKVLIHAGAGGVGSAAIGLAHHLGAEVFATASPAKWEFLREAGVAEDHIASSRDLDFREKFLAASGGEGVDVVLNSLAGEVIDASLDLLPRGGRFVEMGKIDVREPAELAAERPNVHYRAFDLFEAGAERIGEILGEVVSLLERGDLRHPALASWDVRRAREAFHHLREGENVGKVVLELEPPIDPRRTVLVTGATGALGGLVARRLVERHGARHLLLVSRSGAAAAGADELADELRSLGAEVHLAACDVSQRSSLAALLADLPGGQPLGAVIHAAGALDDATIDALDPERIGRAFAPKAEAAWHLHELTATADLSAFICFSSVSGVLGGAAQGNYAAANLFCDALAQLRRSRGQPATSIAWGLWAGEGMASHLSGADVARLRRSGIAPLSEERGLALFDEALAGDAATVLAMSLDRGELRGQATAGTLPPILSGVVRVPARRAGAATTPTALLGAGTEAERKARLMALVRAEVAVVLGHGTPDAIDPERAFKELGFDSLAAVELRNRVSSATGQKLSSTVVFDHPTCVALADHLLGKLAAAGKGQWVASPAQIADEPIAIVGMACRYPGVSSVEDLWSLVDAGGDAIAPFPGDRGWDLERLYHSDPDRPGTSYAREGGFLTDAGDFDAEFFGIAPREALATDPQQRQLLEVVWQALETAGIDPGSLRAAQAGVFAGVSSLDYTAGLRSPEGELEGLRLTGGSASVVSGRVAYHLGLEGPAITVDTACSSSLVALHLASQALRGGECSLALAGGVTVLGSAGIFTEFSRQRGLAPDGRCKSFAEAADGTGFSEGVGVLVLERLSDAERNGHPVLATIRGSAVNQDGASNGLTAPNGPSQERVIRQALANARLTPQDIDAVEAHGTGTTLGDPIEAGALLATYGQDREEPLKLGSIKSNIGHTQAAAGVAGVIKMVMAMREGVLPRTLHVDEPSSKVDWEAGRIELVTEPQPWAPNGHPRRAGVSSFGISGTNAHLILEEAPQPADAEPAEDAGQGGELPEPLLPGPLLLPLSAKSEPALRESAKRLAAHLAEDPDLDPTDVGFSLATTRSDFERRAVAVGEDREELLSALSALARGEEAPSLVRGLARAEHRPVFLFPGQGSQWQGMALELLESSPAFATHMAACEEALSAHVDWSLAAVLRDEKGEWLNHLDIVQPALFAVMVSLARLWMDLGVEPAVLLGHSQGEIAAAHIAGGLSLGDAALIVSRRARAMAGLAGKGAMLSVSSPLSLLRPHLEPFGESVSVAAINGPASLALSGEPDALAQLRAHCEQEGIRAQPIAVDYAAHSIQIDALREELLDAFAPIDPKTGRVPFHSTVTGEALDTVNLDPEYWYCNLRQTVLFEPALRSLLEDGHRTLIELAPHPVLAFGAQETIEDALEEPSDATVLGTLRREEGGPKRFALSLAEAHAAGASPDWQALFRGSGAASVALPTYPFQRKRYWLASSQGASDPRAIGQTPADHPLLGAAIEEPDAGGLTLTGRLSLQTHPWLADHAVAGTVLLPGTAFVELALRAGSEVGCETLEELTLQAPLLLPERGAVQIQVSVGEPAEDGGREIAVYSRPEPSLAEPAGTEWATHATGLLGAGEAQPPRPLAQWPPEGAEPIDVSTLYERLAEAGFEYGPAFQGAEAAWRCGEELFAEVSLAPEQAPEAGRFAIHPALLDSALHVLALSLVESGSDGGLRLPFAWREVSVAGAGADALRVRIVPRPEGASISLANAEGEPLAQVGGLALRAVDPSALAAIQAADPLLGVEWREVELVPERDARREVEQWRCGLGAPGEDPARRAITATAAALGRMQQWLAAPDSRDARLAIVTENAFAADEQDCPDPAMAAVWGLVRSAQAEHPDRFALVDTDGSQASLEALPAVLAHEGESQFILRDGIVRVPRAARLPTPTADLPPALDPERTVLITGGTGTLGALTARHLVTAHGARHLLLASRGGGGAEGAQALRAELAELGAEATVVSCDVSAREQLEELLGSIPDERPLGAIFHLAGALDDATIESLDPGALEPIFAPKAEAAWHLHELSEGIDLSAFVCYSSVAGTLGSPGQANYASANAFCDALAQLRRARGLPAVSIAWGHWASRSGLSAGLEEADLARLRRFGIASLSDADALSLLDRALTCGRPDCMAVSLASAGLRELATAGALPPMLAGLVRVQKRRSAGTGSLARTLAGLPEPERGPHVLELVMAQVAAVLGHVSGEAIDSERAFKELGFDSLAAVELRNRLGTLAGLRLGTTVVFDHPSPSKLAAHLLAEATAADASGQVAVRARVADDPVAIVGMSCRYPGGAESPDRLWELLAEGVDATQPFPDDRGWELERLYHPDPGHNGTSYGREGGFLEDAAYFDAEFFGISPREATATDPQERLLLEGAWRALEDAGLDPSALGESQTGVFAGVMYQDYGSARDGIFAGMSAGAVSGRVAYHLGLEGPAITVDTACSSSLVALHLASQALRGGECSLALAGGVTVLATPSVFIEFSRQRGLAPDGRCKSFAEAADGTGFSEGVGVLVLERLSDAERNGHPVLATIRGSAVNQDGASNGLTAPNGPSQERVIRQALANARLTPQDIDAVEAHGTGTTLGDPIEAGALLATYGQDREEPLKLGSIKSNIGHTQAAAGVAGVIKMVMAMREGVLPRTLHVDEPSSKVDWEAGRIELLTEAAPWEPEGHPRRGGVSSFGASGTNAHLILEEAPQPQGDSAAEPGEGDDAGEAGKPSLLGPTPLPLSAKSEPALRSSAARLAAHMRERPELDPADLSYSLATSRALFEQRAVAFGEDRGQLLEALDALAQGATHPQLAKGRAKQGSLAYLFTGQGSQRPGMGAELHRAFPAYAEVFDRICGLFDRELANPLAQVLFCEPGSEEAVLLANTAYAQPALFATEVALHELLRSWGIRPDLLAGHSIGEIAAAHIAGVLSLPDAVKLVAARGRLMGELPQGGAMVAIEATEQELGETLAGHEAELSIAAINGPRAVVLSGARAPLEELEAHWQEQGRKTKRLDVSHAFHSPLMEPMLEPFAKVLEGLELKAPQLPVISNLSGELLSEEEATDPAYWVRHARGAVRFADAVASLDAEGATTYLELGPDPVLCAMASSCLEPEGEQGPATLPTLREGNPEPEALAATLAAAHVNGASPDWETYFKGTGAKRVPLPTYPFQRKRYWLSAEAGAGDLGAAGLRDAEHPLLGALLEDPSGEGITLTGRLSLQTHPWLADHAVAGTVLLPGTAFVELALRAGSEVGCETLEELTLQAPLLLPERGAVQIQVSVGEPADDGGREISIHSRPDGEAEEGAEWTCHAQGVLSARALAPVPPPATWPPEEAEPIELEYLYDRLAEAGFEYGPAFQGLRSAWLDGKTVCAEVALPEEAAPGAGSFRIHPALLDAALQTIDLLAAQGDGPGEGRSLPFAWAEVAVEASDARRLRVRLASQGDDVSAVLFAPDGSVIARVGSLSLRPIDAGQLRNAGAGRDPLLAVEWKEVTPSPSPEAPHVLEGVDLAGLREEIQGGKQAPPVVLAKPPLGEPGGDPAEAALEATRSALGLVRDWLAIEELGGSRLAFQLEAGGGTGRGESPGLAAAALWGLLRSAQAEHPGRFLLLESDDSEASRTALGAALASGEPQLALREGLALAPRLVRREGSAAGAVDLDPDRTILITGGTGSLGAFFARHLVVSHGVRHLLLVSRSGTDAAGAAELQAELGALGGEARIEACDVGDREQLAALLSTIPADHPLGAVIHTAGTLDDGLIESMAPEQVESVFSPKARAAWHLHELTAGLDLSAFVLFSSLAGTLGSAGQANYAAANAFLDGLAAQRRAVGLPAVSIAWGLWADGMASKLGAAELARLRRSGIAPLGEAEAAACFDAALAGAEVLVVATRLDLPALRSQAAVGGVAAILEDVAPAPRRLAAPAGSLAQTLASAPEEEHRVLALGLVRREVATVLGHGSAEAIAAERPFKDLGFDSLAAVELRNRLNLTTGVRLATTAIFDYPTSTKLAEHLLEEVAPHRTTRDELESGEGEIRDAIASIPVSRLRKAGLLDPLIRLATPDAMPEPELAEEGDRIDTMDVQELIRESVGGREGIDGASRESQGAGKA